MKWRKCRFSPIIVSIISHLLCSFVVYTRNSETVSSDRNSFILMRSRINSDREIVDKRESLKWFYSTHETPNSLRYFHFNCNFYSIPFHYHLRAILLDLKFRHCNPNCDCSIDPVFSHLPFSSNDTFARNSYRIGKIFFYNHPVFLN